jgi:hypothetical protein
MIISSATTMASAAHNRRNTERTPRRICHSNLVDVFGFILLGLGATLWNIAAMDFLPGGIFRAQAGHRMLKGGPAPWFMVVTPQSSYDIGKAGMISGIGRACTGAVMLGVTTWFASRDWHLWGRTLSILGESSTPHLEVLGLFVTCTTAASLYLSFRLEHERHLPAKKDAGPRTRKDRRKAQSRATGTILVITGASLCAVCVALAVYLTVEVFFISAPPYIEIVPIVVVLSGPVYVTGQNLVRRGRRHFVTVLSGHKDLDDFVLYLRWFKEDSFLDRAFPRFGSPLLSHFLTSGASEEEQLAKVLKPYGRVVAVGDPTDALPRVGADRFYLPFEGWQETVRELMTKARLVVLSLGTGEGTLWELVEAMSTLPPERLILLVPMNEDDYETFRREAQRRLQRRVQGRKLPDYQTDPRSLRNNVSQGYRAAMRRTRDDSYMTTITEAFLSSRSVVKNSQVDSVFQAVVHFPSWDAPVFARLDTAVFDARRPFDNRDPRYAALKMCLSSALERGRS